MKYNLTIYYCKKITSDKNTFGKGKDAEDEGNIPYPHAIREIQCQSFIMAQGKCA